MNQAIRTSPGATRRAQDARRARARTQAPRARLTWRDAAGAAAVAAFGLFAAAVAAGWAAGIDRWPVWSP